MQLECLGTGGYFPNERRHTAGYLFADQGILFDAGTSAFRVDDRLETDELDIFLSHAHLDHIVGLTFLLVPILNGSIKKVRLHGRPQDLAAVKEHLFAQEVFPVEIPFEFCELQSRIELPNGGSLTTCELQHPGGSTGYRIDWPDRSFAYITDSTVNGTYTEFTQGVDLLLHECYFPDEFSDIAEKTGHSHTSQVAELAKAANVKRLGLIHIDPFREGDDPVELQVAQEIFPNTFLTEDNMQLEF